MLYEVITGEGILDFERAGRGTDTAIFFRFQFEVELLMEQLDNVAQIAEVFGADKTVVIKIRKATETLKESLIDAIKELHPEHVFAIPDEKSKACAGFLNEYLANA